jgi:hypothetical protein
MNECLKTWQVKKRADILALSKIYGKLNGKAFPARAAILVKLLDLDETIIGAVYEKPGSMKIGHYLPGTRIPILSDEEFWTPANIKKPIVNFAWHISPEVRNYLYGSGFLGEVIDIISNEDFA